jgi:alanine-glyoxylate transaminase/(R)-3-amino-2-methylpropionate-pyruvate transaminase
MTTATAPRSATLPQLPPFNHKPAPYTGPSKAEVLAVRKEFCTPALVTYYRDPIMLVEGKMQYLYDETGRRYLDALGGIVTVSVGHCHPRVMAAVNAQNALLQHATTIYLHPTIAQFAKKLASTFPKDSGLTSVYFVNSGSEANDLAVLMARAYTGNFDFIALRNAYHGGSSTPMALTAHSTWKFNSPHSFGIQHALLPDRYRGPYGYNDANAGEKYAADVLDLIRQGTSGRIAGFIAEPIQGVGGVVEMPPGYLPAVYAHVKAAGGLCIADEVQTGFGRTGDAFWGFENALRAANGVSGPYPDIVTMAKGIGNGCPLAAVVTRPEIAKTLTSRIHFNTFGGNPVSMAQGLATLEVLLDESYQQKAKETGAYLRAGLERLAQKQPLIGDIRGRGLMLGVELVESRDTKAPATRHTADIFERCKDLGLLLGKGGFAGNVLRIKPPMCLTKADCDFLAAVLDVALTEARG